MEDRKCMPYPIETVWGVYGIEWNLARILALRTHSHMKSAMGFLMITSGPPLLVSSEKLHLMCSYVCAGGIPACDGGGILVLVPLPRSVLPMMPEEWPVFPVPCCFGSNLQ